MSIKNICVFCGSNKGKNPQFLIIAKKLGELLGKENYHLIYGGARVGLMGAVADATLENGGKATGVLPRFLAQESEVPHLNLTELKLVDTMHERKSAIYNLSHAFIVLPGGIGSLEEFAEILTWLKLGAHNKPICLLNIENFYTPLLNLFQNMIDENFMSETVLDSIIIENSLSKALEKIKSWTPLSIGKKWHLDEKL